jgi:MFS superfamily sulfate permease-like transporter
MTKLNFCKRRKRSNSSQENIEELSNYDQTEIDSLNEEHINVERRIYNYTEFTKEHPASLFIGFSLIALLKQLYHLHFIPSKICLKKNIYNRLPALKWLIRYNFRKDILADLLAGITVGIMHIPQGMAYSLLATLPPIYGLYTSFYPVLIYWIFGTSRHISIGTFAVVSLMVSDTLAKLEPKYAPPIGFNMTIYENNIANNISNQVDVTYFLSENRETARVLIAMANAFWVGIFQIIMFFFQLGFITSYLSEPFINSFLAGSAVHVFTSQLKFIFGIKLTAYSGAFKIPKVKRDFLCFKNLFSFIH